VFLYQQNQRFFAQLAEGLEEEGADELGRLGARAIRPAYRGVYFEADKAGLYRINYRSRLATRVVAPLASFTCHEPDYLYRQARLIDWKQIMGPEQTLAVFANLANSKIRHSQYAALCVKDAVADYFREQCGRRPDVARIDPDVWINVFIENNRAVISLDASGGSLHRRGYRREGLEAPMQETVAAAAIRMSGWDGTRALADPMCGSGTLLAEALMRACRVPAGFLRARFGFERLPDFDRRTWEAVKAEADGRMLPLAEGLISGSDISGQAVKAARTNCRMLPGGERIALTRSDFRKLEGLEDRVIVCNPPYGIRLGGRGGMEPFYKELGDFLKRRCRGSEAFIYFGDREMIKHIGLKPSWKKPLKNGGLDGRLCKYSLY
jgi:putative N6-adenine-specific DNA methylase